MINIRTTYVDTAHSASVLPTALDPQTGGAALGGDRVVKKIIVGKPVAGASLYLFHNDNAIFNATTNIAFKYTFPTFGAGTPASDQFNFCVGDQAGQSQVDGLVLYEGGSIETTSAMQVTVLWDDPAA